MGFKLSKMKAPLINTEFEKDGEKLKLSIDGDLVTPLFLRDMRDLAKQESQIQSSGKNEKLTAEEKKELEFEQMNVSAETATYMANVLSRIIKKWDAIEDNGKSVPLTYHTFSNLGVGLLGDLFAFALDSITPKKTKKRKSAAT